MSRRVTRKPPRFQQDNSIYFLTFCTFRRSPVLLETGIPETLLENLRFYAPRLKNLIAYTIMPDHVHLLTEVETVFQMSAFLRDFKKRTSKEIKQKTGQTIPIWQSGTFDHCIRSSADLENHLNYIFYNSWKHLEILPKDFPYHNFKEAVGKGWIEEDFRVRSIEIQNRFTVYE